MVNLKCCHFLLSFLKKKQLYYWWPFPPWIFLPLYANLYSRHFCMGLIAGLFEFIATNPHLFGSLLISLLTCFWVVAVYPCNFSAVYLVCLTFYPFMPVAWRRTLVICLSRQTMRTTFYGAAFPNSSLEALLNSLIWFYVWNTSNQHIILTWVVWAEAKTVYSSPVVHKPHLIPY